MTMFRVFHVSAFFSTRIDSVNAVRRYNANVVNFRFLDCNTTEKLFLQLRLLRVRIIFKMVIVLYTVSSFIKSYSRSTVKSKGTRQRKYSQHPSDEGIILHQRYCFTRANVIFFFVS